MKKVLAFAAFGLLLTSCTKEMPRIPHPEKYKVAIKIDMVVVRSEAGFKITKESSTRSGNWYTTDGDTQHEGTFRTGGDVDIVLREVNGVDEDGEWIETGRAVIHMKFKKGTETAKDITGAGTWTFGKIEGAFVNYLTEGGGLATYKYDFKTEDDADFRYPVETIWLNGLMKK